MLVIGAVVWRFNFTYSNYTNIWFHFAVIVNLTNKTIQAYVNGVALTSYENPTITENTIPNNESLIGLFGNINNNSTYYIGYVDDYRIYDKALSSDEVNRIMAEIQKDPVVHYKFDGDFTDAVGGTDLEIGME